MDDKRLWDYRAVRDLAVIAAVGLVVVLLFQARSVLVPVVAGFALAYMVNPLVIWARRRLRMPRWLTTALLMLAVLLALLGVGLFVVPRVVGESYTLATKLPAYSSKIAHKIQTDFERWQATLSQRASSWMGDEPPATQPGATQPATQPDAAPPSSQPDGVAGSQPARTTADVLLNQFAGVDMASVGSTLWNWLATGVGVVSSAVSLGAYLALATSITLICFFYFSWRFDAILAWFEPFIPADRRARTLDILKRMDNSVSAWLRGRVLQAFLMIVMLSVGWSIVDVPYALLLGICFGTLNLVPYMSSMGMPVAVLITWADRAGASGHPTIMGVLILPVVVYVIAQSIDGWLIEPLVQGQATNLDPLSVMIAVLVGASLAGVLGMILAIPVAACIKIVMEELVLPRLRNRKSL